MSTLDVAGVQDLLGRINELLTVERERRIQSGQDFNIFRVMGMETDEVHTHTALIAELLDPEGSHHMGGVFLGLFVERLVEKFDPASALRNLDLSTVKVAREKRIPLVGQIDILIQGKASDQRDSILIIENKIYARDQDKQLERYSKEFKEPVLAYLTLNGAKPSQQSLGGIPLKSICCISYEDFIIPWLRRCREEAIEFPLIRETLSQYLYLVGDLTGSSKGGTVENEIMTMLRASPRLVTPLREAYLAYEKMIANAWDRLESIVDARFGSIEINIDEDIYLQPALCQDSDGVNVLMKCKSRAKPDDFIPRADPRYPNSLHEAIRASLEGMGTWTNPNYVAYFNPKEFKAKAKFADLASDRLVEVVTDDQRLEDVARQIVEETELVAGVIRSVVEAR